MTTLAHRAGSTSAAARTDSPQAQGAANARAQVATYASDFAAVLPSHVSPATFVRVAQGALKKGKKEASGLTKLEEAAAADTGSFLLALMDAARLGLEPGTEEFYLTPRREQGRAKVLGIVGWQGYVELMYRAGAISSVVVEAVRQSDGFTFNPARDEVPSHEIDWDADERGELRLVYAFARMKGGGTSRVIVLNRKAINEAKAKAEGTSSQYSPWNTNTEAMWLKTAIRRLAKYVPTSAEYRAATGHDVAQQWDRPSAQLVASPPLAALAAAPARDAATGDLLETIDPLGGAQYDDPIHPGELAGDDTADQA